MFSRQFATMIDAGIPILRCLEILSSQTKDGALRPALEAVTTDVKGGLALNEALAKTRDDGDEPDESQVGLALSVLSLAVMPGLGLLKRSNARRIGSRALIAESSETLICSYLSLTLFVGLGANAAFGWWWADIAAALAMVPWIVKEGLEGLRGEACEDEGEDS